MLTFKNKIQPNGIELSISPQVRIADLLFSYKKPIAIYSIAGDREQYN